MSRLSSIRQSDIRLKSNKTNKTNKTTDHPRMVPSTVIYSMISAGIHIAIVYVGIFKLDLDYLPLLAALVLSSFVGSLLMRAVLPPSTVVKQMIARLKGTTIKETVEITVLDLISLAAVAATAYMVINRFGSIYWVGVYVATTIATLLGYFL
jgi:glucan phosphoethanolaminetransferase (alkaline phosphatase superfamily)